MKKIKLLLLPVLIISSLSALAQGKKDSLTSKWEIGLALGYTHIYPSYDYGYYPDKKIYQTGGFDIHFKYMASKLIHINFGLAYDMLEYKGSGYYPTIGGLYSEGFKYSFLNIPIQLNFNFNISKLSLGISPGITIGNIIKNEYMEILPPSYPGHQKIDTHGTMINFISLAANICYKLNNRLILFSEAQFLYAITPISYQRSGYDGSTEFYVHIEYSKISLGIFYSLKK